MNKQQKLPPYFLVKILGQFRDLLLKLNRKLFPGSVVLYEQFQAFWLMQPLYIAAKLDIAGFLKNGPLTVEELARLSSSDPAALYRIMRALASSGIFRENEGKRFGQNSRSRALLEGDGSMRHMIIHHLGQINWSANANLLHTVKTGENAFTNLYGTDIYPYLQKDTDELKRFEKSMNDLSALAMGPVLSRYDFGKFNTIADIGGGEGMLLAGIVEQSKRAKGILFDLPENHNKAEDFIKAAGLSQRISYVPVSFLEPFSLEADLYIMKNVLHNWDDEHCCLILENLRRNMNKGSILLVLELVVPGPGVASYAKMVDIQMLSTMPGGRERTGKEYASLLSKSGLGLKRIIPTIAPLSILETSVE